MSPAGGTAPRGRLVVLSGPSGVGKDTVIRRLLELVPGLRRPVAYTSRSPRSGERDGREYSFVSRPQFEAMRKRGEFLETASVHGNLYGTARSRVEELLGEAGDVLLKPDVQGAAQLRRWPGALFIFLAPPSREELKERLLGRGTETPAELALREDDAERELAAATWYQRQVVNDEVERAAREIAEILGQRGPDQV